MKASETSVDIQDKNGNTSDGNWCLIQHFKTLYPVQEWETAGYFTQDYLWTVNAHWLQFGPQSSAYHLSLMALYLIIMIVGISGNTLVVYLFFRKKSLHTPANILVVNLAISDLLMMLKLPIFIYNSYHLGPALGDKVCRFYGFIGGLSGTCSIWTITAISMDRYFVIKYPLSSSFSSRRAKTLVITSWLYAGFFSIMPLLDIGLGRYVPEGFLTSCSFDYLTDDRNAIIFIWAYAVAAYVLPITLICSFYCFILTIVKSKARIITGKQKHMKCDSQRHMRTKDKRKQEMHVTLVVLRVILVWFLAWTPYSIVALLGIIGYHHLITPLVSMIPALFCKSAACCDPFIYALTHSKFREELRCLCGGKPKHHRTFTGISRPTTANGEEITVRSTIEARASMRNAAGVQVTITRGQKRCW